MRYGQIEEWAVGVRVMRVWANIFFFFAQAIYSETKLVEFLWLNENDQCGVPQ